MSKISILFVFLLLICSLSCKNAFDENTLLKGILVRSSSDRTPLNGVGLYTARYYGTTSAFPEDRTSSFGSFKLKRKVYSCIGLCNPQPTSEYFDIYTVASSSENVTGWMGFQEGVNRKSLLLFKQKNVKRFIRTIEFERPLTDSLLLATGYFSFDINTVYGPISAGTVFKDTLYNFKIKAFKYDCSESYVSAQLWQVGFQRDSLYRFSGSDEEQVEIKLVY